MPSNSRRSTFLAGLLGALVIALPMIGLAIGGAFSSDATTTTVAGPTPDGDTTTGPAPAPARSATDVSALYERVGPGVASIEVGNGQGGRGTGSGFLLDDEGYILTNDHVVEDAQTVRVRFGDGDPITAKVTGTDPSTDLAVLKIDPAGQKLTPLSLGSSKSLKVGEPVVAIGSPFGLDGTLTTGVISALGRSIKAPNKFDIDNVVQTDAAINPGNSGGPLLDANGQVIGINAQIATSTRSNSGVGFAIPIDAAKAVLDQLKSGEQIKRAFLGVTTQNATSGSGAIVRALVKGGPADDAGLRVGDRIVSVGGEDVKAADDVSAAVLRTKPGDDIKLGIRRGGAERTLDVTLGTRPQTISG